MLTSRAKYALRACMLMAERKSANGWSSAAGLASTADIPRKFLEAILTQLRDQGLVESRRGPAGGHRLVLSPEAVTTADVIRAIDGPLAMTPCASTTAFRACDDCVAVEECRLRHLMLRARDAVAHVLEECTLAELCRQGLDVLEQSRPAQNGRSEDMARPNTKLEHDQLSSSESQ